MDPRSIMRFLNEVFREANPGMVHVLAKLETANVEGTFFITIPSDVTKTTADIISETLKDLSDDITGGYKVQVLHRLNQSFSDEISKAVIKEALSDVSNHADGNIKFLPTKVAYFVIIETEYPLDKESITKCRESFDLFGADGKFHRVIIKWEESGDWEILEYNREPPKKEPAMVKPIKAEAPKLSKVAELDDPARLRTRVILAEDITNFKILLGQTMDVNDVVMALDKFGAEED